MPRLSIVIPCQTCDERFENTLASVLQNRPQESEVIAVFSGTYEDPYELGDEVRFLEVSPNASLLDLINVGVDQSQADVVNLLGCGVEVEEGWADAPLRRFSRPSVGSVAPVLVSRRSADGRVVAGIQYGRGGTRQVCRVRPDRVAKRTPHILGPSLQAAFYHRDSLRQIGGMDSRVGEELADIDAAISLKSAGLESVCEPESRVFMESDAPAMPRHFGIGANHEQLFWKHAGEYGLPLSLCAHAMVVTGEVLQSVVKPSMLGYLFGRMYGMVSRRRQSKTTPAFSEKTSRPRSRQRNRSGSGTAVENGGETTQFSDGRRRNVA